MEESIYRANCKRRTHIVQKTIVSVRKKKKKKKKEKQITHPQRHSATKRAECVVEGREKIIKNNINKSLILYNDDTKTYLQKQNKR